MILPLSIWTTARALFLSESTACVDSESVSTAVWPLYGWLSLEPRLNRDEQKEILLFVWDAFTMIYDELHSH